MNLLILVKTTKKSVYLFDPTRKVLSEAKLSYALSILVII